MRTPLLLAALALAGFASGAGALSTDREQPVRIDSDRVRIDSQRGVAVYEGNVVLTQGSLRITGRMLTMRFGEGDGLSTLVSEGDPARFRQRLDGGEEQHGWAERIEYRAGDGAMIFIGEAGISQGQFEMEAHRIDYDTVDASIEGASAEGESEGERVTLTVRSGAGGSR